MATTKRDTHQIGGISGANLVHNARTMHFYRARADAQAAANFLVRRALRNLCKHLAFARRQKIMTGKIDAIGACSVRLRKATMAPSTAQR
jgi:hypothetical protein